MSSLNKLLSVLPSVVTAVAAVCGGAAYAQSGGNAAGNFPTKPITIVFSAGGPGSVDTEFRLHTETLRQMPNMPTFTFEYRGGAGGILGIREVARAAPDGYTLLGTAAQLVTIPAVDSTADFDPIKSFSPIMLMSKRFYMIMVHPAAPYKDLKSYVSYAKSHPEELFYGATGAGTPTQMPGLLLNSMTNVKVTYVFYKNPNDRLTDLMGGRINVAAGTTQTSAGLVKAGKLRAIGQTGDVRSPLMPDLPTVAEAGIKGYEYSGWLGLLAPANTPPAVVNRINGYFQQSAKSEFVTKKMKESDTALVASTPEGFAKFLREEVPRMTKVIKEAGITSIE